MLVHIFMQKVVIKTYFVICINFGILLNIIVYIIYAN